MINIDVERVQHKDADYLEMYTFLWGMVVVFVSHNQNSREEIDVRLLGLVSIRLHIIDRGERAFWLRYEREKALVDRICRGTDDYAVSHMVRWNRDKLNRMIKDYPKLAERVSVLVKQVQYLPVKG